VGGSGGGYFRRDPKEAARELEASDNASDDQEYQAQANEALSQLLNDFNNRDADAIGRRLQEIKDVLNEDLEGTVDLRFGGSVAKHTFVDGLSDIDSLVLLNRSELAEYSPEQVRKYFADRLRDQFDDEAEVTEGTLAVTLRFDDVAIQLLPALKTSEGYRIGTNEGTGWAHIRPREFTDVLTGLNAAHGSKVVPVIKLAKGILWNMPERQRLSGYHTESLAVDIFRGYQGPRALRDMLQHFFAEASKRVQVPIPDATGQSGHVDAYLGAAGSLERRLMSDTLDRVARRIHNAGVARSVQQLTSLFEP
jgi:SMODS domain-containing protein